ncbi:MAG: hypothetical protein H6686_09415 [Fibrobacteria bacterium]|nr:hypothetical protein [Fibrobacteria bacterium]
MFAELLLLGASLSAGLAEVSAGQAMVAMAENEGRLESNPALLGSDSVDRRWHGRLTLPHLRMPLDAYGDIEPHLDLLSSQDPHKILGSREFLDDLWKFDGRPVSVGAGMGVALWQGDWAISSELWSHPGIRLDRGVAIPVLQVWDSTQLDIRAGLAQPFGSFRIGVGLLLRGQTGSTLSTNLRDPSRLSQEIDKLQDSITDHFQGVPSLGAGLDLGILQQLPHGLQWGARIGELGLLDAWGDLKRPLLDVGAAWIPPEFRRGPRWDHRLALGVGLRDLLETDMPFLSHLDLGLTTRHNLSPRATELRASAGLRGGWPSAGVGTTLGPVLLDVATWVQDLDRVLGRTPLENWEAQVQLGW